MDDVQQNVYHIKNGVTDFYHVLILPCNNVNLIYDPNESQGKQFINTYKPYQNYMYCYLVK